MRVLGYVRTLIAVAGGGACTYPMTTVDPGPAAIIVHNDSDLDVDVYIWDGWDRATRLGFLAASDTTSFEVAETITAAPGPYYLEARGVEGAEYPTQSETFALRRGYRITWNIPPADALGAATDEAIADTSGLTAPASTTGDPPPLPEP